MKLQSQSVSIAAANFNNARFLEDFFESVLASTVLPAKCIVCDDGSTDGSEEIIASYANQYDWIDAIYFPENRGVAHATNAAIAQVDSEFVLRVDTDDMLLPLRIEAQEKYMSEHPDIDILGGNCTYFDSETGADMHDSRFPADMASIKDLFHKSENGVLNGTTMIKRACFEKLRYNQDAVWAEDYDLFARLLHAGYTFAAQVEPLTRVRIHRSSVTSNLSKDTLIKANNISQELFGVSKSNSELNRFYKHLTHYRRYMMDKSVFMRYYNLLIALLYRPSALIDRIVKR